jgi:hypothetical protein
MDDPNGTDIKLPMGSGGLAPEERTLYQLKTNVKLANLVANYSDTYLPLNFNKPFIIHIPHKFDNFFLDSNTQKLEFKVLDNKDCSQSIKDLKRTLNFKDINHINDIDKKIRTYNDNVSHKLKEYQKEHYKKL